MICIAGDFTRYDEHAVKQISRNIELIRYRRFGDDLLLLDLVTTTTGTEPLRTQQAARDTVPGSTGVGKYKTIVESQGSPHFQTAPNISLKTGCAASIWANCWISGRSRGFGMVGMSS